MKTLNDHTIIYDDECPMCDLYTRSFVRSGMLDLQGREKFGETVNTITTVDWKRAANEIALVNRKDSSVRYGVDSLMFILCYQRLWLKRVFENQVFYFLMQQMYFFISYNRKVIVPGTVFEGSNTCTPDLKLSYRWAYIGFCWIITSLVLVSYVKTLALLPSTGYLREVSIVGGQILFQGGIVWVIRKERSIHYLGNLMTVSLAGSLLLVFGLLLTPIIHSQTFFRGYFVVVVGLMFLEHMRRVKILQLSVFLSASWVLYRILVLLIIL